MTTYKIVVQYRGGSYELTVSDDDPEYAEALAIDKARRALRGKGAVQVERPNGWSFVPASSVESVEVTRV